MDSTIRERAQEARQKPMKETVKEKRLVDAVDLVVAPMVLLVQGLVGAFDASNAMWALSFSAPCHIDT